jgi:hypothetical protein
MTLSTLSTKELNIQRAAATARFVGGTVRSIERGPRSSWTLTIQTPHGLYPISLWDDDKPQHAIALDFRRNDIVTLQVHAYEHPVYQPWKIYDILEFDDHQLQTLTQLNNQIRSNALSCNNTLKQCEIEARQLGELDAAAALMREQRQTQGFWSQVAGISSAVGAIATAPLTGGASLLALPGSCMLVFSGQAAGDSTAITDINLRHRRENLGNAWYAVRQQATQALHCVGLLEQTVDDAKLLPWKATANGNAYGILPPSLKHELHAIACSEVPASQAVIDVQPMLNHLTGAKPARRLGIPKAKN